MFQRLLIIGIIGFWLAMTGALLQLWVNPAGNDLSNVPVEHVVRQMFHHEQASNLSVMQGSKRMGSLMLQPRRFDENGIGLVDFSGSLMLELPFMSEQPFSWRGTAELQRDFTLRTLRIRIDAHAPKIATDIEILPGERKVVYRIGHHGEEPFESVMPMGRQGIREALESFGIDPAILQQVPMGNSADGQSSFELTARRGEIEIQGERAQTFRITGHKGGTLIFEGDISNLGQILGVKSAFGFSLQPEH